MKLWRKYIKKYSIYINAFLIALFFAGLYMSGAFYTTSMRMNDQLFQVPSGSEGNIFVIGIDDKSLDELGPFQTWTRDYMARAIEALNADAQNRPVVIGIDVMYFGYSNPIYDEELAKVCANYDNIVFGSYADISPGVIVKENGDFYHSNYVIKNYEEPYSELREVTRQGFINGTADADGIMRHGILKMELPDGRMINSFSYEIYQMYAEKNKLEVKDPSMLNERYQWYIPFTEKSGGYNNGFSFTDLLNGSLSGDFFTDKIVLIGPYAQGLLDEYTTSVEHGIPMYGVEIHANMLEALMQENFKTEMPRIWQGIILFIISFTSVIFLVKMYKVIFSLLFLVIFDIGYLLLARLFYSYGIILDIFYLPVTSTIIFIGAVIYHYVHTSMEKKVVVNTFKRYVAPQVVDEIFEKGMENLELGGKLTDIACLFVDIRGFTAMSEILQPTDVVEVLNSYLELTSTCILNHNGTLDKFIGDATMAIFNAPLPQEDYIYQAVLTAWDMLQGAKKLSEEFEKKFGRTVNFGIGVHCGKAVIGNIGTKIRMDYTAIGDTINTASRLESNAPPGNILISRAVYEALQGRILTTSLGNSIKLKGKSENFEIFRIDGLAEKNNNRKKAEEGLFLTKNMDILDKML